MSSCQLAATPEVFTQAATVSNQKRRLRVLTISPFYPSAEDSTQGRFVSEPLEHLEDTNIANKTIAVQPFYRKRTHPMITAASDKVRYFCAPSHLGLPTAGTFLSRRLLRNILEEHRRNPFDLIHAHAALPCGHASMLLGRHLAIPFVVSVHGLDAFFVRQAGIPIGSWCKRIAKQVYSSAAFVICISEKVQTEILKGVKARTTVIYNGVDTATFSPGQSETLLPTILSVGNLIPSKGHANLIRAFEQVSKLIPCALEIVGDGPDFGKLVELASNLNISEKVRFRGRRSKEFTADAMRRCTVFALPSVYEGLGCVYLEAMACAKPVIGCERQGIAEVIQHGRTGLLVPAENVARLRDAITALLRDPNLRQALGAAARELMVERFTLQHQAEQLAMIYRRCSA